MKTKTKKFQMRLSPEVLSALYKLAEAEKLSASAYLERYIRDRAKAKGIKL